VTWRQRTFLALGLTGVVNVNLVTNITRDSWRGLSSDVLVQAQTIQDIRVIEEQIGVEGGGLGEMLFTDDLPDPLRLDGFAGVVIYENSLTETITAKLTISETHATDYPEFDGFSQNYPTDKVKYIGQLITLELPLDSLDWQGEEEKNLVVLKPPFYEGVLDTVDRSNVALEFRIPRSDGVLVFYTFDYNYAGEVVVSNHLLQANLQENATGTLTISVQAVDLSEVYGQ
jgi:hypothetical protein